MAVSAKWYGLGLKHVLGGDVNWTTDTIKVSLHTSTYAPNQDTDEFFTSATNELATANGYTAGGAALGTKSVAYDATSNDGRLLAATTTWTATTGNTIGPARYAVVRKDTGTAGTSILLGYVDFGADVSATGATLTITWDATNGVLKATAA